MSVKMITIRIDITEGKKEYSFRTLPDPMEWILEKCDKIKIEDVSASFHTDYTENHVTKFTMVLTFDHDEDLEIFKKHYSDMICEIEPLPWLESDRGWVRWTNDDKFGIEWKENE